MINLAGGAMLGLLLGCGVALLRQRSDRNLRNPDEVTRLTGLPVLVSIPESSGAWLADTTSVGGRAYVRLRNVLTARVANDARIILVAGIDGDGSEVADNLAATLARTGAEVILVSPMPDPRQLSGWDWPAVGPGCPKCWEGRRRRRTRCRYLPGWRRCGC